MSSSSASSPPPPPPPSPENRPLSPPIASDPGTVANALSYIVSTVVACQQRGGYSLEEAVSIHAATTYFVTKERKSEEDARDGTQHLTFLVRMLEKSQSLGKLSME